MSAIMKVITLLACLFATCMSFAPTRLSIGHLASKRVERTQSLFAKKKEVAPAVDANGKEYWQGDWVCAGNYLCR